MTAPHVLCTSRLDLEPVRVSHAQEAWPHLDDERMWRYFPSLRPATIDQLRALYRKWESGSPDAEQVWLNWMCRERAGGVLAGGMQATVFPPRRVSYIAYAIYPAYQRKGYAREAAQAVITFVAQRYGVERFLAEMDTRNEASYRLAESLGFTRVETRLATECDELEADEFVYELTV